MNVFFIGFGQGRAFVPKYFQDELPVKDIHLVVNDCADILVDCKNYFIDRDCQLGRLKDMEIYNNNPLDANFLAKMAISESTVLKMMDRYQYTQGLVHYEQRINLYHKQLRYWHNYLINNRIDICFFAVIPHVVYDFIIYSLCKELGIQTFMLYRLPVLPGKNVSVYILNDIKKHIPNLFEAYNHHLNCDVELTLSKRMEAYLELREGNEGKTFTGIVTKKRGVSKYFQPSMYVKHLKYRVDYSKEWLRIWGNPHDLVNRLTHYLFTPTLPHISFKTCPDLSCQYIFVALHYQPECTTSPMGDVFVHQDLMLDILVKTLPKHLKVYVKPHPRGGLSKHLVRRLQLNSRMEFIDPDFNSYKLISNCLAVATITGTSGWEGFINKKPVLMFGEYFYQDAPGIYKIKSCLDASHALEDILSNSLVITDRMVLAFLKAVDEKTFPGWVDNRYSKLSGISDNQNAKNIAYHLSVAVKEHM